MSGVPVPFQPTMVGADLLCPICGTKWLEPDGCRHSTVEVFDAFRKERSVLSTELSQIRLNADSKMVVRGIVRRIRKELSLPEPEEAEIVVSVG